MRLLTAGMFLAGLLAMTTFADAQPPGGPGGKGGRGGGGQGGKGGGFGGFAKGPPQPGQILPAPIQEMLKLSDDQKKKLAEMQKDVDDKLDKMLTGDQKKQLQELKERGPGGFGGGGFGGGKGGPGGGGFGGKGGPGGGGKGGPGGPGGNPPPNQP